MRPPRGAGALLLHVRLSALRHVHAHGWVYRDVKLENVLIDGDGYVKICDLVRQEGRVVAHIHQVRHRRVRAAGGLGRAAAARARRTGGPSASSSTRCSRVDRHLRVARLRRSPFHLGVLQRRLAEPNQMLSASSHRGADLGGVRGLPDGSSRRGESERIGAGPAGFIQIQKHEYAIARHAPAHTRAHTHTHLRWLADHRPLTLRLSSRACRWFDDVDWEATLRREVSALWLPPLAQDGAIDGAIDFSREDVMMDRPYDMGALGGDVSRVRADAQQPVAATAKRGCYAGRRPRLARAWQGPRRSVRLIQAREGAATRGGATGK